MNSQKIDVITHSEKLEGWLEPYHTMIGSDLEGYRGHLYRVLNYTLWFLDGDEAERSIIEFALVYHDIGLWSDKELAYLEPSIDRALAVNNSENLRFDPQLIKDAIYYHHKFFSFNGDNKRVVNAIRKADWVDATKGMIRKGMPKKIIGQVNDAIPVAGFYDTLARLAPELTGNNKLKTLTEIMKVYKL